MIESDQKHKWVVFYNEEKGKIQINIFKDHKIRTTTFEPAEFRRLWKQGERALKDV